MLRRLESYEVDIIRLRAVNAAKDTELASSRDQLQVCSEVKDVEIARITNQVRVLTAKLDSLSAQSKGSIKLQLKLTMNMCLQPQNKRWHRWLTSSLLCPSCTCTWPTVASATCAWPAAASTSPTAT